MHTTVSLIIEVSVDRHTEYQCEIKAAMNVIMSGYLRKKFLKLTDSEFASVFSREAFGASVSLNTH